MSDGRSGSTAAVKQVLVVRRDLRMRRGKEIAQGAHASQAWLRRRIVEATGWELGDARLALDRSELTWLAGGSTKITVYVRSEAELLELHAAARAAGVHSELVDALTARLPLY